jgi:hypothetical protein
MEFPPFSATTTGEKASQTDGFQSIRRIDRYPLRSRDKDAPLRLSAPTIYCPTQNYLSPKTSQLLLVWIS